MFIDNKYTRWYLNLIGKAQKEDRIKRKRDNQYFVYYESHHIVPRCMGGKEVVLLTPKEHFVCHLLLCRMFTGIDKHKMINALIKMSFSKSKHQQRYTARSFNLVRKLIAEKNSEKFKGVPKSSTARANMRGKSGTWKRTNKHLEIAREAQKKRFQNKPGTFTGRKFTKEMAEKRKITRQNRGIKPPFNGKGCKHYTNGTINKFCLPGTQPEGFYEGRVMKNASAQK